MGDATLTCLGPLYIRNVSIGDTWENANSLVLMLSYGETDILLTGDATAESMREIEAAYPGSLRADVFKNAHHAADVKADVMAAIGAPYTILSTDETATPP